MTTASAAFFIVDNVGHPALTLGGSSRQPCRFEWEPDFVWQSQWGERRGAYVLRFVSLEDMLTRQFEVLSQQRRWTVYVHVELVETEENPHGEFVSNKLLELHRAKTALEQRVQNLEVALADAEEAVRLADRPALPSVQAASHVEPEPPKPQAPVYGTEKPEATEASDLSAVEPSVETTGPEDGEPSPDLEVPPAPAAGLDVPPPPAASEETTADADEVDEETGVPARPSTRPGKTARKSSRGK